MSPQEGQRSNVAGNAATQILMPPRQHLARGAMETPQCLHHSSNAHTKGATPLPEKQ
jgi:hypothetical protein